MQTKILLEPEKIWVKICGITRPKDAHAAIAAGVDALGFNGFKGSKRYLNFEDAQDWLRDLNGAVLRVAVLVNETELTCHRIFESGLFDMLQLHGDESWEFVNRLRSEGIPILKAIRIREANELSHHKKEMHPPCLIDVLSSTNYGGTGESIDWNDLGGWITSHQDIPAILAGGLSPENVKVAILSSHARGVDVAGGVELSPGIKCENLMTSFIQNARAAKSYSQDS